jgi:hypothetical protein
MKKEVIAIRKKVLAGESNVITERVKYDGVIEGINVRFYAGQENELIVMPYIFHKGRKMETFFTYPEGTDPFLSGEDDHLEYPLSLDVEYDDEIHVRYENKATMYDYTLVVDIIITYYSEPSARTGGEM